MDKHNQIIGVFDSGIGGISVLREIWKVLPDERFLYIADQANVPYGSRTADEVRFFSEKITRFLLDQGARLIVVACNTASAAALYHLRQTFPDIRFVGMEPAVKPAAETTNSGQVGVLATPATFQGELYISVVERFSNGVQLMTDTCPGLVQCIESGDVESDNTRRILEDAIEPMLERGVDTIVLGCTHYPFVMPLIQSIAGPSVRIIDPSHAVARQVRMVTESIDIKRRSIVSNKISPIDNTKFFTSGNPTLMKHVLELLLDITCEVNQIHWIEDHLVPSKVLL